MINDNENKELTDYEDDELGIELPDITTSEQGEIISVLEDTFLIRLDNISQFGEHAIDMQAVEKFVKRFPKHKDKIDKILAKSKVNKPKDKKDI